MLADSDLDTAGLTIVERRKLEFALQKEEAGANKSKSAGTGAGLPDAENDDGDDSDESVVDLT